MFLVCKSKYRELWDNFARAQDRITSLSIDLQDVRNSNNARERIIKVQNAELRGLREYSEAQDNEIKLHRKYSDFYIECLQQKNWLFRTLNELLLKCYPYTTFSKNFWSMFDNIKEDVPDIGETGK